MTGTRKSTLHRLPVKIGLPCLITILLLTSTVSLAQNKQAYTASRTKLLKTLKKDPVDKSFTAALEKFYFKSCDSLLQKKVTIDNKPVEVMLTRLFDACDAKISNRSISLLRIPAINTFFLQTLEKYKKQPIATLYRGIGITQSDILASAFDGTPLGDSIAIIVGIREMLNNPYYVSTRFGDPRYVPFRDTLLYFLANGSPEILTEKLVNHDTLFTSAVSESSNLSVRSVGRLTKDKYYENVLPFSLAILEDRVTADSIIKLSLVPPAYYRAFTDETIRIYTSKDPRIKTFLEKPIAALNERFANKFYIDEINTLHESPDNTRFRILQNLSPRELYFILVGGTGALYTSSFLYTYKKFIKDAEKQGLDNFFRSVDYYQFGQFLTNVSVYGLVDDLVEHLQPAKFADLVGNQFRKLLSTQLTDNEIMINAMTMSEILYDLKGQPEVQRLLLGKITAFEKTRGQYDIMLQRMLEGFKNILQNKTDYTSDPTYDVLPVKRLQKNNTIVQAVYFYDDEDGTTSFESSLGTYDKKYWEKKDLGNYVLLRSLSGNAMRVYMNKPNSKQGSDSSQDEMLRDIASDGYEISSFIHRGHSYHLSQSLRKISPSARFVFLGSCGGFNEVLNVFRLNPDVNIIVTRNIGSKQINDPLLQRINLDLVNNKDINWDKTWAAFNAIFTSKQTKDLFSSYIPPNRYIGVKFIRKVFSY